MTKMTNEDINILIECQLREWPLATGNFENLRKTRRRLFSLGALNGAVQLNPARVVSTGAKVDKESIEKRPCFLCEANRPKEQLTMTWVEGWHLLVNPYPIFPIHFTIVNPNHHPQGAVPLIMASMAEAAPVMVIFYNGARAGASAPDHQHTQGVLKSEIPLLKLVEDVHPDSKPGWMSSEDFGVELPFQFMSAVVTPDNMGMRTLAKVIGSFGIDSDTGNPDFGLVNAFMWIDKGGFLRIIMIPRRSHRPVCYHASDADRIMVSPGAIDMAGVIITPREEDFEKIDEDKIREIYSQVAFADKLPDNIKRHFLT